MLARHLIFVLGVALAGCNEEETLPPLVVPAELMEWRTEGGGNLWFDVRRRDASSYEIFVLQKDFRKFDQAILLTREVSPPIYDLVHQVFEGQINLSGEVTPERYPTGTWTSIYITGRDQQRHKVTSSHVSGELRELRYWLEAQLKADAPEPER